MTWYDWICFPYRELVSILKSILASELAELLLCGCRKISLCLVIIFPNCCHLLTQITCMCMYFKVYPSLEPFWPLGVKMWHWAPFWIVHVCTEDWSSRLFSPFIGFLGMFVLSHALLDCHVEDIWMVRQWFWRHHGSIVGVSSLWDGCAYVHFHELFVFYGKEINEISSFTIQWHFQKGFNLTSNMFSWLLFKVYFMFCLSLNCWMGFTSIFGQFRTTSCTPCLSWKINSVQKMELTLILCIVCLLLARSRWVHLCPKINTIQAVGGVLMS